MMSPSEMKPVGLPAASTSGAALIWLFTSSCMASSTVAFSGSVYTSRFMIRSMRERCALSSSAAASSPGLLRTSATVSTKPSTHRAVATANAAWMPNTPAVTASVEPETMLVATVDADTMTAVPSEPATWRNVFCTEVPWFISLSGSAFMPQVEMGMFTSDRLNRRTV